MLVAKILVALVALIHVYIVLLATVLFRSRGKKVFAIESGLVDRLAPLMSNQGCYNGFLVAALLLGLFYPEPSIAFAFQVFGLACVAVAGIWGGFSVSKRILLVQTVPAILALVAIYLSR